MSNKASILNKTPEQALEDVVMPTVKQWIELKVALENAINGPLTHNNLLADAPNGHKAHYIGIHPGEYDALGEALSFTLNDDLEIF